MTQALIVISFFLFASSITAQPPASSAKQIVPQKVSAKSDGDKSNIEVLIDRYFDSLNESDDKRRRDLTKSVWSEKGKFGTPYGEVEGLDAIDALVAGVHRKFPNAIVRRTTKIDGFGTYLRWGFTLSNADGTPILSGVDFAIIENGKLQLVMGFFDFAPTLENK